MTPNQYLVRRFKYAKEILSHPKDLLPAVWAGFSEEADSIRINRQIHNTRPARGYHDPSYTSETPAHPRQAQSSAAYMGEHIGKSIADFLAPIL